ncbi:MAG: hypothetical protein K2W95_09955 [Candidatus Obscuribacterales bacterium]|nr:hypothetical protein [Candidatus Obscuribacterales bacterium]
MATSAKLTLSVSALLIATGPAIAQTWQEDDATARALMRQGRYDEAQDALLHGLAACPPEHRGLMLIHIAIVQRKSGDMAGARKTLTIAKELASKDHDTDLAAKVDKEIVKLVFPTAPSARTSSEQKSVGRPPEPAPDKQLARIPPQTVNGAPKQEQEAPPATSPRQATELPEPSPNPVPVGAGPTTSTPSTESKTLKAGVEMQASLPALDQQLTPGNTFDQDRATRLLQERVQKKRNPKIDSWRQVPPWLAGSWTANQATTIYSKDFRNGFESRAIRTYKSESEYSSGDCADATGQPWERENGGWTVETRHERFIGVNFVTKEVRLEIDNRHTLDYNEAISFQKGYDGSIIDSFQCVFLTFQEPVGAGVIRQEQRKRVYDARGRKISEAINVSLRYRTRPFVDTGTIEQRESLSAYLQSKDLGRLAPLPVVR